MAAQSVAVSEGTRDSARMLAALIADESSATHPHVLSLGSLDSATDARNAADALHHIALLHGRYPGVIEHASNHTVDDGARHALFSLTNAFAKERDLLGRLVVAAGPIPSTPGQSETEASVVHQRHALEMLAQSDRQGCAAGAAIAVALDWHAVRRVMAAAARRFGVDAEPPAFPDEASLIAMVRDMCGSPATERALLFGAQQIAMQHRGLWDLLEARAHARIDVY